MNDTVNVKKDQLAKLISLVSSIIDKDTKTGNEWFIRTGTTIDIGDVTSNSENIATETTLNGIKTALETIAAILEEVRDPATHAFRTDQVAK